MIGKKEASMKSVLKRRDIRSVLMKAVFPLILERDSKCDSQDTGSRHRFTQSGILNTVCSSLIDHERDGFRISHSVWEQNHFMTIQFINKTSKIQNCEIMSAAYERTFRQPFCLAASLPNRLIVPTP